MTSGGAHTDALQRAVDTLATRLGRSVAVDDPHGRLVVASRHFGDEDPLRTYAVLQRTSDPRVTAYLRSAGIHAWTAPGRVPANPELGFTARVACPVRAHGIPFGHLFLIEDDPADDREVELAAATAAEIAGLMYHRLVVHDRDTDRRDALLADLLAATPTTRVAAQQALLDEGLITTLDPLAVLSVRVLGGPDGDLGTTLRVALERLVRSRHAGRVLTTATGPRGTVVVTGELAAGARAVADDLVADLARADGIERVVVGCGAAGDRDGARRSHDEARRIADAAAVLPGLGDVVDRDGLGAYAVLLAVPPEALTADLYPPALRRLLDGDHHDVLVDTLEAYLDRCGDATATAGALRIHRSTLYYRLGRIEALAGVSLHDGTRRLELHLGVTVRRLVRARPARSDTVSDGPADVS